MKCPRDNQPLNRQISERMFGDGCNQCNGIFLTGKKAHAYQTNLEKQLHDNSVKDDLSGDSILLCPDCNTHMNVTYVDKIEIDICKKCLGVWFDKTEAQAIIQKYNQDSSTNNSSRPAPFPSEFVHLLSKWFLHNSND